MGGRANRGRACWEACGVAVKGLGLRGLVEGFRGLGVLGLGLRVWLQRFGSCYPWFSDRELLPKLGIVLVGS